MPLKIVNEDIITMRVDCIVNSTNRYLECGGHGVDYSIHQAAGPALQAELDRIGYCPVGCTVTTDAYQLPCRHIIHGVGPVWHGGLHHEKQKLAACYRSVFSAAKECGAESLAMPVFCAGANRFPKGLALEIARRELRSFLSSSDMTVYLVVRDRDFFMESAAMFDVLDRFLEANYEPDAPDTLPPAVTEAPGVIPEYRFSIMENDSGPYCEEAPDWDAAATFCNSIEGCVVQLPLPDAALEPGWDIPPVPKAQAAAPAAPYSAGAEKANHAPDGVRRSAAAPHAGLWSAPSLQAEKTGAGFHPDTGFRELDKSFAEMVLYWAELKNLSDPMLYHQANVHKAVFNKLKKAALQGLPYQPSKSTALALALGLRLNPEQATDLLMRAGYAFSHANKGDLIVEYYIREGEYDVLKINEVLWQYDQTPLGNV